MKRNVAELLCSVAVVVLAACTAQAQMAGPATLDLAPERESRLGGARADIDLEALKAQLGAFQDVVNRDMVQAFAQPFVLLQDTKGTYLPGFGVLFHLELNLHPLRSLNIFDPRPYTEEELETVRQAKLEKVRELKVRLSALLLEHGTKLTELPTDQNLAVVAHLFNMPSEGAGLPTQVVMETSRQALLQAQAQRLAADEFARRQTFLEF